jgi:hypothetical protein
MTLEDMQAGAVLDSRSNEAALSGAVALKHAAPDATFIVHLEQVFGGSFCVPDRIWHHYADRTRWLRPSTRPRERLGGDS